MVPEHTQHDVFATFQFQLHFHTLKAVHYQSSAAAIQLSASLPSTEQSDVRH